MIDYTGQRFGLLVVTDRSEYRRKGEAFWNCACDCGSKCIVRGVHLRTGNTQSCGCFRKKACKPETVSLLKTEKMQRRDAPKAIKAIRGKESGIIRSRGFVNVMVSGSNAYPSEKKWRRKQIIVWEQYNGSAPEGCAVLFADGDKSNFDISNLLLISKNELGYMSYHGMLSSNAEYTKTGIAIAKLAIAIKEKQKEQK